MLIQSRNFVKCAFKLNKKELNLEGTDIADKKFNLLVSVPESIKIRGHQSLILLGVICKLRKDLGGGGWSGGLKFGDTAKFS